MENDQLDGRQVVTYHFIIPCDPLPPYCELPPGHIAGPLPRRVIWSRARQRPLKRWRSRCRGGRVDGWRLTYDRPGPSPAAVAGMLRRFRELAALIGAGDETEEE